MVALYGDLPDFHDRLDLFNFLFHYNFPNQVFTLRFQLFNDALATVTLIWTGAVLRRVPLVCLNNLLQNCKLLLVRRRDEVLFHLQSKSEQHASAETRMVRHLKATAEAF